MNVSGDEAARLSSNGENTSQVGGKDDVEAIFNEMQKNMTEKSQNTSDQIIENSHSSTSGESFSPFKPLVRDSSKITNTDCQTVSIYTNQAYSSVMVQNQEKTVEFSENCPNNDLSHESSEIQLDQPSLSCNHQSHIVNNIGICRFNMANQSIEARPSEMVKTEHNEMIGTGPSETVEAQPNQTLEADANHMFSSEITKYSNLNDDCNSTFKNDIRVTSIATVNGANIALSTNQALLSNGVGDIKSAFAEPNLVTIPVNCEIIIRGSDGSISHGAESLNPSKQGVYNLYECPMCKALFRSKNLYRSHVTKVHNLTCPFCGEPCEGKEAFENHIVLHVSESEHFDSPNTSRFNGNFDDNHVPIPRKRKTVLRSVFCQTERLVESVITISDRNGEETNGYGECEETFNTERSFQLHQQRSHGEEFKCSICLAIFTSEIALQNHSLKHA